MVPSIGSINTVKHNRPTSNNLNDFKFFNRSLLFCTVFRYSVLTQHGVASKYVMTSVFIAHYQVDVTLPSMHTIRHLYLCPKVYVTVCFFHVFFTLILSVKCHLSVKCCFLISSKVTSSLEDISKRFY